MPLHSFSHRLSIRKSALWIIAGCLPFLLIGCASQSQSIGYQFEKSIHSIQKPCPHTAKKGYKKGYIEVGTSRLFYQSFGTQNKASTPIIVLHGGPGLSQDYLLPQMATLAKHHTITFFDQRGSGKSIESNLDNSTINTARFVEDIEAVRQHLGYDKFILIGHSWGVYLASNYAFKYPSRLSSLILLNGSPSTSTGFTSFITEYNSRMNKIKSKLDPITKHLEYKEGSPVLEEKLTRLTFSQYTHQPYDAWKLQLPFTQKSVLSGRKVMAQFVQSDFSKPYDLRPKLKRLKMPTLIVHGHSDVIPQWTAEETHQAIPHSKLVILPQSGHFPYIEEPDVFFDVLNQFID